MGPLASGKSWAQDRQGLDVLHVGVAEEAVQGPELGGDGLEADFAEVGELDVFDQLDDVRVAESGACLVQRKGALGQLQGRETFQREQPRGGNGVSEEIFVGLSPARE